MHPGIDTPHEFTAAEIIDLLDELDGRLKQRGVSATIFVVGGAAIAVSSDANLRRTQDIDAIMRRDDEDPLLEVAHVMANERGLPDDWLNPNARMWMPPLPEGALQPRPETGLHVSYADNEFLLATKLIAQRRRDAQDIIDLADRLGLHDPRPHDLESLIRRYYTDDGDLELILDGNDVDRELRLLSENAARMLSSRLKQGRPIRGYQ